MRLCIRCRDRAAAVAHCRRLEETLWRELELLPSGETCLLYKVATRGGQNFREEGDMKDWQPTSIRGAIPVGGRLFGLPG
jgi:hypothetical protein